jgi:hypothetical protein
MIRKTCLLVMMIALAMLAGARAEYVTLIQQSVPSGIVSGNSQVQTGITTNLSAPMESGAYRFSYWIVNGSEKRGATGEAINPLPLVPYEATIATAYYLDVALDADADGLPDWYESRFFGSPSRTAFDDEDGDGIPLKVEYQRGYNPHVVDRIDQGGISRRVSDSARLNFSSTKVTLIEESDPLGMVTSVAFVDKRSTVTTTVAPAEVSGYKFVGWFGAGGDRLDAPDLSRTASVVIGTQDAIVTARYLLAILDADSDGLPDWYEHYYYSGIALNGSDDSDGDGVPLIKEFQRGYSPAAFDAIREGGVSRRTSTTVGVLLWNRVAYQLISEPLGLYSQSDSVRDGILVESDDLRNSQVGDYRFAYWRIGSVVQSLPQGQTVGRLSFYASVDFTATAVYLPFAQDSDSDGLPDWYEWNHVSDLQANGLSDQDGDGWGLKVEYHRGYDPHKIDEVREGGISRRGSATATLNMQFFPASQLGDAGGNGIFSDPYRGSSGSLVMPGGSSHPTMGDMDGDGDMDLIVGGVGGAVKYLRNTGSPFEPEFLEVSGALGGLAHWPTGRVYPALADWNGDGLADLAVGSDDGVLRFYQAQAGGAAAFAWVGNLTAGTGAVYPAFLPGATGPDLLVLHAASGLVSRFAYGSGQVPYISSAVTADLLGTPVADGTSLSVADVTGDGIVDVIAGDLAGRLWRFNGSVSGSFALTSKVWAGSFDGFRAGLTAAVVDVNGDGSPDVIGGGSDGRMVYLRSPEKHLRVDPAMATVGTGEFLDLSSIDDDGTLVWSMRLSRSGGGIHESTGLYTAGSNAGIDQVMVRNAAGRTGVAWINVIRRGGPSGIKWRGLLVDGRRGPNDPVWPASHALTTRAREILKYRGLSDDSILWLGHGAEANALPTRAGLASALNDGTAVANDTEVLMVYLADHGRVAANGDGLFLLSENESVSGTELDAWLDHLQATHPNLSVVMVVESCFGGRVAGPMSASDAYGSRRLVMASSSADQLAHLAAGGLVSYSTMWWSGVASGKTLAQAHDDAAAAMASLQAGQRSAGGAALAAGKLGLGGVAGSGRPVLTLAEQSIQLQGTQETQLSVTVESAFAVDKVWGVVVPPGYRASGDAPVVDLTEVDLAKDAATGQWTANVGGFSEGGAPYTVLLQARDAWGQVSTPAILQVSQSTVRNRVIIFAHAEDGWEGAAVAGSLAAYAREVALLRRVREQDVKVIADGVFAEEGAAEANVANLQDAIESWANADGQLGALTVFAVGQGSQEGLICANGDAVTPGDLQGWLNNLQDESGSTVQLIVDSDYSGRFVAGAGSSVHRRVVVSSTGQNERNTFANGRWSSVTRWMWNAIARGRDLRESYGEATDLARMIGGSVPALFDDNGDGAFTRLSDGLKAINAFVGSAYVTADDPPFIGKASAMMQVASGQRGRFWVSNIIMPDGAAPQSVWCEVLGPDGTSRGGGDLWHNPTKDRHEGSFASFGEPGRYFVFVQAGTRDDPARTTPPAVILIDYAGIPDHGGPLTSGLPALTLPLDGRTMDVESGAGGEWSLPLTRGQRIVIEAREVASGCDVALQLIGANDRVLSSADVWGNGFGEIIDGWEAPADGTYRVRATFATGSGAAECKVRALIKREAGADGLVVLPSQSITFNPPATRPVGGGAFNLTATATSGLPVRFEVISGPASLAGNTLAPNAGGAVLIRAMQDGNAAWDSADPVERSISITTTASQTYETWAQSIFGADYATKGSPQQDADADGQSNEAEWLAKTDPKNGADRFHIASVKCDATGFHLRWLARDGVNYRVTCSTDLTIWTELPDSRVIGIGAEVERGDSAVIVPRRFYRVEVVQP